MADALTLSLARPDVHIDVHDDAACRYWCTRLGLRPKALKHLVRVVGSRAADVEAYVAQGRLHAYIEDENTEANPT